MAVMTEQDAIHVGDDSYTNVVAVPRDGIAGVIVSFIVLGFI